MSHVGAVRVSVLVHQPFPLGGVCVPCANVLRLQVLQLAVDVVTVRHLRLQVRREAAGEEEEGKEKVDEVEFIPVNPFNK